eukprot:TRINITY_DN8114_c0_g3_i1.p4 TRINITY_DN8114_c0_g3~~TRINITY_DN8114_c0_g3_i1.p4  ORF type:complete len:117 (+),score=38.98 TRINITY_DN8114_c0_g3_i1:558-908(+)
MCCCMRAPQQEKFWGQGQGAKSQGQGQGAKSQGQGQGAKSQGQGWGQLPKIKVDKSCYFDGQNEKNFPVVGTPSNPAVVQVEDGVVPPLILKKIQSIPSLPESFQGEGGEQQSSFV